MSKINKIRLSGTTYDLQDLNASKAVELTQAQYDALQTKDPDTFYIITDASPSDISGYWTSAETESAITESISGKADTSAVTQEISAAVSGKADTSAVTQEISSAVSGKADSSAVTQEISAAVSGKVDTSAFTEYSASTNARISEDEEVTAAALNALNDELSGKADSSSVYTKLEVDTALNAKQNTLVAGSGITISGNVISADGSSITVDSALSSTSENPVQNKVIYQAIGDIETLLAAI